MKLYAIIGYPIKHSFSPLMQNAWFKEEDIDALYIPFEVHHSNLKKTAEAFKTLGFCGINATIPHKTAIMKYIDSCDKAAKTIGSVNTISLKNGKMYGFNTDYSGFSDDLAAKKIKVRGGKVLVFGAGGAARGVLYALKQAKAGKIWLSNRTIETAEKLAKEFAVKAVGTDRIPALLPDVDLIINASACGMKKDDVLPFEQAPLKKSAAVYDLIYNKKTPFAALARKSGAKYFSGEGMLINQGARAFEIWTGKYPDIKTAATLFRRFSA